MRILIRTLSGLLLFIPLILSGQSSWQVFSSTGTVAEGVRTLDLGDSTYLAISNTNGYNGYNQVYFLHLGYQGQYLSDHAFDLPIGGTIKDAILTTDGRIAMTGLAQINPNQYQGILLVTDLQANPIINNDFGSSSWDFCNDLCETADTGFLLAGQSFPGSASHGSAWLVRTKNNGDTLWTNTLNLGLESEWQGVIRTSWGYAVCGYSIDPLSGNTDVLLGGFSPNGDTIWTKTWGDIGNDWAYDIALSSDGYLIIAGATENFGALKTDGFLLKTDSLGNEIWKAIFPGINSDRFMGVVLTDADSIAAAGVTNSFGGGREEFVLYLNGPYGNFYGGGTYGGPGHDFLESITACADGSYLLTGSSSSSGSITSGMLIVKTDHWGFSPGNTQVITSLEETEYPILEVYPNPASEVLHLPAGIINEILRIRCYDLSGRQLFTLDGESSGQLDISFLSPGMYFLDIRMRSRSLTAKFLKTGN